MYLYGAPCSHYPSADAERQFEQGGAWPLGCPSDSADEVGHRTATAGDDPTPIREHVSAVGQPAGDDATTIDQLHDHSSKSAECAGII